MWCNCKINFQEDFKMGFEIKDNVLVKYTEEGVTEVVIPDGVTKIGEEAFLNCKNLTSITIPDSVTEIADGYFYNGAFSGCLSLTSINIPDSVTKIGNRAFYNCPKLTSIMIPDSVTIIGEGAFIGCKTLASITIPSSVTEICNSVFYDCSSLISITIPDGVEEIGDYAFKECSSLKSVSLPDSIIKIGKGAFEKCSSLASVTIPDSVVEISKAAFSYCSSLTSITIPNGLTKLNSHILRDCTSLKSIVIPDGVTEIGDFAFGNSSISSAIIPDSVTKIGEYIFWECINLVSVIAPPNKQLFGKDTFGLELPKGLRKQALSLSDSMSDGVLKQYILTKETWKSLTNEDKYNLFFKRHTKGLFTGGYCAVMTPKDIDFIGEKLLEELDKKTVNLVVDYISNFSKKTSDELLLKLYNKMKTVKGAEKAIEKIEDDVLIKSRLNIENENNETCPINKIFLSKKMSQNDLKKKVKDFYSLDMDKLPKIKNTSGDELPSTYLGYLLIGHERRCDYGSDITASYQKPGINPEMAEILKEIDNKSLQSALKTIANENLGKSGHTKKMFLAYPICRYADDNLMDELTKAAPKWRSNVSGNNAPPLYTFRMACMYSESRYAMLFAEKYKELDEYAAIRKTDADTIRDKYMSDIGLDSEGRKKYDLGNQIITATLQKDLSFVIETEEGKIVKSIPKKGADEENYALASADFTNIKKSAKKISQTRINVLFEDFLSGRTRKAEGWTESYLSNILLRRIASLIVWSQGKSTFTLTEDNVIDSAGNEYKIDEKTPIAVAHPMDMDADDLRQWQKYFNNNALKQPFLQVWEPVANKNSVKSDRYAEIKIPFKFFMGSSNHGIYYTDYDFHNAIELRFVDCFLDYDFPGQGRHTLPTDVVIKNFSIDELNRKNNHVISLLDRWTFAERVEKDDVSVIELMNNLTLEQIMYYLDIAQKNKAINCTAMLLELKNKQYPDFDPMDEYVL